MSPDLFVLGDLSNFNQVTTCFSVVHSLRRFGRTISDTAVSANFEAIISWLPSSSANCKVRTICSLLVQALVYALWKERNLRLHISKSRPPHLIIREVKGLIKAKLIGLDRATLSSVSQRNQQSSSTSDTYLLLWFRYFDAQPSSLLNFPLHRALAYCCFTSVSLYYICRLQYCSFVVFHFFYFLYSKTMSHFGR